LTAGAPRTTPPDEPGALYSARLSDPRQRAALPQARGRTATRAVVTSDVTRFRGLLAATVAGASVTIAAAVVMSPRGGLASPGPLSLPHAEAKLACPSCHGGTYESASVTKERAGAATGTATAGAVPSAACAACHGAHGSERRGHAAALASGALTCAGCHPIHRSDQGVTFTPTAPPVRFAPGVTRAVPGLPFQPPAKATVAIVSAGSCKSCHDLTRASDPIARCLLGGQEALGDARPIMCFDEHQRALPDDERRTPTRPFGAGLSGIDGGARDAKDRVCAGQHIEGRAAAWDAAREAAALVPVLPRGAAGGSALTWIGAGLIAAALVFGGVRGAHALARQRASRGRAAALPALLKPATRVRLPQIDASTCLGCYACVDACPYDVLDVTRYVAVVVRPEACCGLTLCEQRCPNGSLRITDGEPIGDLPRLGDALESLDVPGVYLAGDITGLPLIKNAIHQGALAADRVFEDLTRQSEKGKGGLDLLIIGAGPAGISAALRASALGLAFAVVEQGDVAQSIQSFPRGKLVFDQPLELPTAGKLWLKESTKEELLLHWMRIVRRERLPIHEGTRMTRLEKRAVGFCVTTEPREGGPPQAWEARRVIVAVGQRGSPRRLPFPLDPAVLARVHYHLADARSFEGKRVVVVGLGDVAMEAAVALCRQRGTKVTVVHRGEGFARGKARNIEEVRREVAAGRLVLRFDAEVTAISAEAATIRSPHGEEAIPCDAVLVLIGSVPSFRALAEAGIRKVAEGPAPGPGAPRDAPGDPFCL
jgi:thioredoxin reductase/NAD-dependent dihydropyrimidine dehydrogenase PreA subunit